MFFKKLVDKMNDKVIFDVIPKTNEESISVTYGCIRYVDSYRFLASGLDSLVRTLVDNNHKTLKNLREEIVDNDEILDIVTKIVEDNRTIEGLKGIIQMKKKFRGSFTHIYGRNRSWNFKNRISWQVEIYN